MSKKLSYNPSDFVCNIPIEERLKRVPEDAEWWEHQWSTSDYFDIGRICFEALAKLNAQQASLISDVEVIERLYKEIQVKDEAIFNSQKQAYNLAMQVQNQQALIEQLEKTQDYLYKTHDADKAEIEALKEYCSLVQEGYNAQAILLGVKNAEISKPNAALLAENIVKGGNIKIAVEALEQIATGGIAGESNNYKDTVSVMRIIAKKALLILGKA